MNEYDNDRWRVISAKVGNGFSASACKEKAAELESGGASYDTTTTHSPMEPSSTDVIPHPDVRGAYSPVTEVCNVPQVNEGS